MKLTTLKLVTIVAEAVLQDQIIDGLHALGAKGFTLMSSEGQGSQGRRTGEIPGANIRIETLVSPDLAEKIIGYISEHYFEHYAVICFLTDAQVLRGEKYS